MKKTLIIGLFAFVSMFLFSGCIDFLEDITYHRDGSGTYKFTMDMGAIKSMIDGLGDLGDKDKDEDDSTSPDKKDPTSDINEKFDELKTKLQDIEGISHFESINDTANYVFGFSFDFKNLAALDKALHKQNDKLATSTVLFSGKKRLLSRSNKGSLAESFQKEMMGDDEDSEMAKAMFEDMKMRTVYHFDRKVKSSSNPNSLISADYKTVTLDYYPLKPEMNKGNMGVGTTIKLKWR